MRPLSLQQAWCLEFCKVWVANPAESSKIDAVVSKSRGPLRLATGGCGGPFYWGVYIDRATKGERTITCERPYRGPIGFWDPFPLPNTNSIGSHLGLLD